VELTAKDGDLVHDGLTGFGAQVADGVTGGEVADADGVTLGPALRWRRSAAERPKPVTAIADSARDAKAGELTVHGRYVLTQEGKVSPVIGCPASRLDPVHRRHQVGQSLKVKYVSSLSRVSPLSRTELSFGSLRPVAHYIVVLDVRSQVEGLVPARS
jgi:hypothetical protein